MPEILRVKAEAGTGYERTYIYSCDQIPIIESQENPIIGNVGYGDINIHQSAIFLQYTTSGSPTSFALMLVCGHSYTLTESWGSDTYHSEINNSEQTLYTRIKYETSGTNVHYYSLRKLNNRTIIESNPYNIPVFDNWDDYTNYWSTPPTPAYNWQSVPSISGKNGILSLAQIKDDYINDGESVSGVSADHFTNLSTENRVDVLINDALPDPETGGTTVTVKYTIPSLSTGSYEYCKLVAKKNSMPEGPEDGDKIINIDPSLTSIVVRGLDELSRYYFVIFIEDEQGNTASSEPMECMTDENLIPPEWLPYIEEINRKTFGKTSDESFVLDRSIGGTLRGVYLPYEENFVNFADFRFENSTNTFGVYAIPYVRIDIDFDESNNRYVATASNLVGASGLTEPEKNYFECIANLQKPFTIRSSYKFSRIINEQLSPIMAVSSTVVECLDIIHYGFAYVDLYVDGVAIDIVSE